MRRGLAVAWEDECRIAYRAVIAGDGAAVRDDWTFVTKPSLANKRSLSFNRLQQAFLWSSQGLGLFDICLFPSWLSLGYTLYSVQATSTSEELEIFYLRLARLIDRSILINEFLAALYLSRLITLAIPRTIRVCLGADS